jgi:glucose-1-phosphate adenylyltransferase
MAAPKVLAIVLAGGEGKRLLPLTVDRAKPAVPFGGLYRMVDFALSNLVNGGYLKVVVLTQYKSHSLDRHITKTWRMSNLLGNYITPVPAQQRLGPYWFAGSADAIYQSFNLIHDELPDYVIVFGADHIYRMDPHQMVDQHIQSGAGVTVAGIRQPLSMADQFGVIDVGREQSSSASSGRPIEQFREKPKDAVGLSDAPDEVYASMGNYVFTTKALIDALNRDALDPTSKHDIGGNLIPSLVERKEASVYDFRDNVVPGSTDRDRGYWRDVGTLDSYFEAHMDLIAVLPIFNLYNYEWPIYTENRPWPPAKFVHAGEDRMGRAIGSMVSPGAVISGSLVENSVVSPNVRVNSWAHVSDSVLMEGVEIGRHAVVRRAILDKNVVVPENAQIGVDLERDRARFTVSDSGVVVIGKNQTVEP